MTIRLLGLGDMSGLFGVWGRRIYKEEAFITVFMSVLTNLSEIDNI